MASLEKAHPVTDEIELSDLLWLYGKWVNPPSIPGWNGFMTEVTKEMSFVKSKVLCMPSSSVRNFNNAPPNNYDTVYRMLLSAANKCKELNQNTCTVTFAQPFYLKARDIISSSTENSNLCHIAVRLGGFHLLMSFTGSIGYIMASSDLKELWNTTYAQNSILLTK